MTDQEKIIYDILCSDEQPPKGQHWEGFVASKIAAALAQPEQEPTRSQKMRDAGITRRPKGWDKEQELEGINEVILNSIRDSSEVVAPPQREWVGLTDEEKLTIVRETDNPVDALAATEAKLKEKNNV